MTELRISISNVGGIDELECTFEDTVNVITGPNASNKTSFLKAIAFGLGHSTLPIKNDAEEARVELEFDGERVVRTARATGRGIEISGEGLLESSSDSELLERFACLLEFNDVRQAVRTNGDFESVLKSPMNLDVLERERGEKVERKQSLQADIKQLSGVDEKLSARKEELSEAHERVERLEEKLDELRERQTEASTDHDTVSTLREERADTVRKRSEYENQIADLEDAIERLDDRIADIDETIAEAREEAERHDVDQLRTERSEIERNLHDIEDRIDVLRSVLTANREMLTSSYAGILGQDSDLLDDTITCWTCGNEAAPAAVEETLGSLQNLIEQDTERRREYEPRLRTLKDEIDAADRAKQRVTDLEGEKRDLKRRRESREESLSTRREQLSAIRDELAQLDEELVASEDEQQSEVADLTHEFEQVQVDLHAARQEAKRLQSVIEDREEDREELHRKRERVEGLSEEITELTDRIENMEARLRDAFNKAMDELLDTLGYEGIERMWLDGEFDLIIAREVDGVMHQDSVEHLSESEREMVGLVLALAGYIAYDVAESVPVLLMDTLGAFDSGRTVRLLEYFSDESSLLITALLPDSANAVAESGLKYGTIQPGEMLTSQ